MKGVKTDAERYVKFFFPPLLRWKDVRSGEEGIAML